jgi:adenylosuccinate lyase
MLRRATRLVEGLIVDADRMVANLEATGGLIHSQAVLLAMVETGMDRDDAYRTVQRHAAAAWEGGPDFREALSNDPAVPLDAERLASCFDVGAALQRAGVVFERLDATTL